MCGIAGLSLRSHKPVPEAVLAQMSHHLAHRGPDGEGRYIHEHTGIIHRRLSIIDVEGGQQPICDKNETAHIVVNGEIYNYKPLRDQLESEGVRFKTKSDSEIPLHLYLKHGLDFVRYLDGMFAIAIYDQRSEDLILARDPVGIKPLYTCTTPDGIAFASEPAALTKSGWTTAAVNFSALPCFLNRQYVMGADTLFQGIKRVMPGEVLRIKNGAVAERNLVPVELRPADILPEKDALQAFDTLFDEKVRTHLQADVPYGAFLSGGIDSSSVLTRMAEIHPNPRSYTVGFENVSVADERAMAEKLAARLGSYHTSVEFSERDFWYYLPQMCRAMDDLVADYATLPTLKLAQCAHFDVKVILSGEGGDEIFAGYGRYRGQSIFKKLLGRPFRGRGDAARFAHLFQKPNEYAEFYHRELPDQFYHQTGFTELQTFQARDIAEWLPNDLLLKLDRCLMHHSLEGRVPLLDREMVAFAFALPDTLKIRGKQGKWLLKEWLNERQPEIKPWSPKRGFTVPIHEWLERKREKLLPFLKDHPALEPVMIPAKLEEWLSQPLNEKSAKLLFNTLCYAIWYDIHLEGKSGELEL